MSRSIFKDFELKTYQKHEISEKKRHDMTYNTLLTYSNNRHHLQGSKLDVVIAEIMSSNIIPTLLVVYYDNYTTNYNQWIRINYLSSSIFPSMDCEDKLSQQKFLWWYCSVWGILANIISDTGKLTTVDGLDVKRGSQTNATGASAGRVTPMIQTVALLAPLSQRNMQQRRKLSWEPSRQLEIDTELSIQIIT